MDSFIREQMVSLSPPDFLNTWTRHCHLRKYLASTFDTGGSGGSASQAGGSGDGNSNNADPSADLKLEGGIKIATMPMSTQRFSGRGD